MQLTQSRFRKRLNEFPPCLVRLLARERNHAPSSRELERITGIDRERIDFISKQPDWGKIRIGEALQFMEACGFDPIKVGQQRYYLRKTKFTHTNNPCQRRYMNKLFAILMRKVKKK